METINISQCIPIAIRCVGEALQLDSENQNKEAYCKYLSSIIYICQLLKDDAWQRDLRFVYNNDTVKLFQLIHHCEERALSIASSSQGSQLSGSEQPSIQSTSVQEPTDEQQVDDTVSQPGMVSSQFSTHHLPLPPNSSCKHSDSKIPSSKAQTLHLPSPPGSPLPPTHRRTGSYGPIDMAYKENHKMISAYRMRTERTQAKTSGYKRSNLETTSKNLSVLRRMSENLVIAKAREEALKQKIRDRQERLWKETNRRFASTAVATKEDQEKRILYTKILEFEQEAVWPQQLRMMLKMKPDDPILINNIIEKIFKSPDHPLTQFLREYQYQVHRRLEPLVKDVTFPQSPPPPYSSVQQPFDSGGGENVGNKGFKRDTEEEKTVNPEKPIDQGEEVGKVDDAEKKQKDVDTNDDDDSHIKEEQDQAEICFGKTNPERDEFLAMDQHLENKIEIRPENSYTDSKSTLPEDGNEGDVCKVDANETHPQDFNNCNSCSDNVGERINNDLSSLRSLLETERQDDDDEKDENTVEPSTLKGISKNDIVLEQYSASKEISDSRSLLETERRDDGNEKNENTAEPNNLRGISEKDSDELEQYSASKEVSDSRSLLEMERQDDGDEKDKNTAESSALKGISKNDDDELEQYSASKDVSDPRSLLEIERQDDGAEKDENTAELNTLKGISEKDNDELEQYCASKEFSNIRSLLQTDRQDDGDERDENTVKLSTLKGISKNDNDELEQYSASKNVSEKQATMRTNEGRIWKVENSDLESEFRELEDEMMEWEFSEDELEDEQVKTPSSEQLPMDSEVKPASPDVSSSLESQLQGPVPFELIAKETNSSENNGKIRDIGDIDTSEGDEKEIMCDPNELNKHLRNIFVDIRFFLEKLQKLIVLAYEELDTPAGLDQCYASVEHPFFYPLWNMILAVLRRVNYDREIALASVMTKHIQGTPGDLAVAPRLCLEDKETLLTTGNSYPYQMAVEEIQKVVTFHCPLEKLECIVRSTRAICQCVEDYWENKGKPRMCAETSIGCDDLLPILGYVIIKSGMAQLVSECSAMEEFIPEGYLMGEEGYCLTTLQTALSYLVTLEKRD